jgi:hypothetical protein
MKLEGKLFRANRMIGDTVVEKNPEGASFVKDLEWCFIEVCKNLDIPIPLWLGKNTTEFARFRQTIFFEEQFVDKVRFDRFQIKLLK